MQELEQSNRFPSKHHRSRGETRRARRNGGQNSPPPTMTKGKWTGLRTNDTAAHRERIIRGRGPPSRRRSSCPEIKQPRGGCTVTTTDNTQAEEDSCRTKGGEKDRELLRKTWAFL